MDIATKVGLQLLLDPSSSSTLFRAACSTAGVVYPAYQTFKVLETLHNKPLVASLLRAADTDAGTTEEERWLSYWLVYGVISLIEHEGDELLRAIPYYYHIKFGFLLWLVLPSTKGAQVMYQRCFRPTLQRFQPKIDVIIGRARETTGLVYSMYKVPIDTAAATARSLVVQACAFWAWFVDSEQSKGDSSADKKKGQFIIS